MAEEVTELTTEEREQLENILGKIPGGELLTGGSSHSGRGNPDGVEVLTVPPGVTWQTKQITPEPLTYFTKEDEILIVTFNSQVGQRPHIRGRFLRPDGIVVPFEYTWSPPADRSQHLTHFTLGEGFLLSFVVLPEFDTKRGQLWVRVAHQRFAEGIFLSMTTLAQGYVSTAYPLSWPWWNMEHSTSGAGVIRFIIGTDPPPGNPVSEFVPANARWRLISILVSLTTSATVADRYPRLFFIHPSGNKYWFMASQFSTPASSIRHYIWSTTPTPQFLDPVITIHAPLPTTLELTGGTRIYVTALNFQSGDDFSAPRMIVEEWIEP